MALKLLKCCPETHISFPTYTTWENIILKFSLERMKAWLHRFKTAPQNQ